MKKSEAIEIVSKHFFQYIDPTKEQAKTRAKKIIKIVEKIGMLPPAVTILNSDNTVRETVNIWEEENE